MATQSSFIHIFLIDPLEKLVVKKDSSLHLMLTMQEMNYRCLALFKQDLSFKNEKQVLKCFNFSGSIDEKTLYIKSFELNDFCYQVFDENTVIHMRLDPPFDTEYLKTLWILQSIEKRFRCKVLNKPKGILTFNEKLAVMDISVDDYPVWVGQSYNDLQRTLETWKDDLKAQIIMKPVDLYQGFGVKKISYSELRSYEDEINQSTHLVMPFYSQIYQGEIRTVFFNQKEIATILKTPPSESFLANVAQGATFKKTNLPESLLPKIEKVNKELAKNGVFWIAYDIIGEHITEINVTCPGLLVELSSASKENCSKKIVQSMENVLQFNSKLQI